MNGKPYYSADNGFACAAAGRGITEALQEHLNVIIRDEDLELEPTHSQLQSEINDLVEDKERLEQQKIDRQESLRVLTDELAGKEVKLSELQVKLDAPLNTSETPPPPPHIDALKDGMDAETSGLEERQLASVKLEIDLEAPTEAELELPTLDEAQVSRFSFPEWSFTISSTIALLGLVFYLFIFYGSVGDRTFTKGIGTNAQKAFVIIPDAFFKAWTESPINLFVITFPFIFLTLAILAYLYDRDSKWKHYFGVLGATFLVDFIIALKISKQTYQFREDSPGEWGIGFSGHGLDNLLEVASVLFLGFGTSFLLGLGIAWFVKMWKIAKPFQDATIQLEKRIRAERNDRLIELNALTTEIQHAENRINDLKQEKEAYDKNVEATVKHPVELEIARVNTEKAHLQPQIDALNEQVESLQSEINQCETDINALVNRQNNRVIDVRKLEARAHEFISGWCRYVAQRQTEETADASGDIKHIQELANETLKAYVAPLQAA